ncbi:LacI family DNA-binding transcriptional regulator [Microbacterium sp. ZW T5_56]|uniref:LacI family DNA-binding transcriptional regulator n=1 Tax=Microbacterium sp. ZW T5_56 TaxID=3378081 RepID=UPI003852E182
MAVQLAQIAEEAGVSVPTVSKVLNSRPDVASATRKRVAEVLTRHGYTVRSRPRVTTGFLDVRIVDLDRAWSEAVVRGAAEASKRHDKDLVLTVDPDPENCDDWVHHALERGSDGLLSVVGVPSEEARQLLAEAGIPLVIVDPLRRVPEGTYSVAATNFQGAFDAAQHLISLGHRRIATITGPLDQANGIARLAGFQAAMLQSGVPVDDELVIRTHYGVDQGYAAARQLLALTERPTAIFAASDDSALGSIRALREHGLRIPDDISVVGFDDIPHSQWTDPPLTTIRQPLAQMGSAAVDALIRSRAGQRLAAHTELSTTLVVRSSSTAPAVG